MTRHPIKRHSDALAILLLFGVFAACILSVLLTGADAYQGLTLRDRAGYDRRTGAQYLATRVRQADALGAVSCEDFDGVPALALRESIDAEAYITYIYCFDGYLRELFTREGSGLSPGDGERVLQAESLSLAQSGRVLTISLEQDGTGSETLTLYLRSGGEAAA